MRASGTSSDSPGAASDHAVSDTSVLSQKSVAELIIVEAEIPKPRQGRYHVAHGVSHGIRALSPRRPPLPPGRERGGGGKGGALTHGLHYVARFAG